MNEYKQICHDSNVFLSAINFEGGQIIGKGNYRTRKTLECGTQRLRAG